MKGLGFSISFTMITVLACSCSNRYSHINPLDMDASSLESRATAALGYDAEYVNKLEHTVKDLRASTEDTRQYLSLLFASDELADVYTYRAVDFKRAMEENQKLEALLANVPCCKGDSTPVGLYFPRFRLMRAFVWPEPWWRSDGHNSPIRELPEHSTIKTIFPEDFMSRVFQEDVQRLIARTKDRRTFLQGVLGKSSEGSIASPQSETPLTYDDNDITFWNNLYEQALPERPYTKALSRLEHIWAMRGEVREDEWLHAVAQASEDVLSKQAKQSHVQWKDAISLQFRAGLVALRLGNTEKGVRLLEQVLDTVREQDRIITETNQHMLKAANQKSRSGGVIALAYGLAVLLTANPTTGVNNYLYGQAALNISEWFHNKEKYGLVESQLKFLFGRNELGLKGMLTEHERLAFHYELGSGYERLGRKQEAMSHYKSAIEIIEHERGTIPGESQRINFLEDKESVYRRLIPLLIEEGDIRGALEYAERGRSRTFVDLLAFDRPRFSRQQEGSWYEAFVNRLTEISVMATNNGMSREEAERKHNAFRGVLMDEKETNKPAALSSPQEQPAQDSTLAGGKVSSSFLNPAFSELESLATVRTASVEEIAKAVGPEAALIAFYVGESSTSVMVLQDGQVSGWVRPLGRQALTKHVELLRRHFQNPNFPTPKQNEQEIKRVGEILFRELMADALNMIKKRVIYLAPHGPLHYLAFASIHDGFQYLVDRFTFLTVPSGTVLTYLKNKPAGSLGKTVIFANPDLGNEAFNLPYAEQEGLSIHARRPESLLLRRQAATEAQVWKQFRDSSVLHFAAHAEFRETSPLQSAVLLTPGDGQDGALTASEVFGLYSPGSLVVLSACETGMGRIASGDELIGLTRAFMYAGARHIIATLWKVDDEATALLMDELYAALPNRSVAEALQQAQRKVRARNPNPFYWAGFTTFGLYDRGSR